MMSLALYWLHVHHQWVSTFLVVASLLGVSFLPLWLFACGFVECWVALVALSSSSFGPFGMSLPAVLFPLNRIFLFYVCYDYILQLIYRLRNLLGRVLVLVVFVLVVMGVFLMIWLCHCFVSRCFYDYECLWLWCEVSNQLWCHLVLWTKGF